MDTQFTLRAFHLAEAFFRTGLRVLHYFVEGLAILGENIPLSVTYALH